MALENKEPMQKYFEASSGCLQNTVLPGNLHYNGSYIYGILGGNDKLDAYSKDANLDTRKFPHAAHLVPEEGYKSPIQGQESEIWAGCYPESLNTRDYSKAAEAHYHSINKYRSYFDYQLQCPSWSHGYLPDFQMQEFQYFVVIDFEATCEKDKKPHPQEIIEFPSVLVNSLTGELEDCFQIYVRPTHNQRLSEFCKELTGIQQIQVDKGVLLSDALLMHDKWLEEKGIKQTKFAIVTWSNWDCRVMLESECRFKKIRKPPYFHRWINLKVPFYEAFGSVNCNLKEAVQMAGLVWEGRAHCGLDDARNTARLLAHLLRWGFKLTITSSLTFPCPDGSFPAINQPVTPCIDFQSMRNDPPKDGQMYCYCGVKSCKQMVRKPGPKHGCFFFGCGNWTASRGAVCPYFMWATS